MNWEDISKQRGLSESFMRENFEYLHLPTLLANQRLSSSFLESISHHILIENAWDLLTITQTLSPDFMRKYTAKLNWSYISKYQFMPEEFLSEMKYRLTWSDICKNHTLSQDFLEKHKELVCWSTISRRKDYVTEDMLLSFREELNLYQVLYYNQYSSSFLEEHLDLLPLDEVVATQHLTEEFILKHQDKFDMLDILHNQTLSLHCLHELVGPFLDEEEAELLSENENLTEEIMKHHAEDLWWDRICEYVPMREAFMEEMYKYINWESPWHNNWEKICRYQKISYAFVQKHIEHIIIYDLKLNTNISFTEEEWQTLETKVLSS